MHFKLQSSYQPAGDQPQAIERLVEGIQAGKPNQVLLGVTGSGKTYTIANVIKQVQKPTLVIAHNKTLAAQLYQEFRDFFPDNAVSYFVSYYDYYQPEAYIPSSDTYIEKEATINDEIDKLRLSTTTNLLTRSDVIVVASVSCIYNLGSPIEYGKYILELIEGQLLDRRSLLTRLEQLQYDRSDVELKRGAWRERGEIIEVWPAYEDKALRIRTFEQSIQSLTWIDPVSGQKIDQTAKQQLATSHQSPEANNYQSDPNHQPPVTSNHQPAPSHHPKRIILYPAKHYLIDPISQKEALEQIRVDLDQQIQNFEKTGNIVAAFRLKQKVQYDLESIEQFGFVNGIENYSRYFDGRQSGQPPHSLLEYFKLNSKQFQTNGFLTVVDESHMTLPQIKGMYRGDEARKKTLIEYGFRLPSALDNRPLRYDEFTGQIDQMIAVSATPAELEVALAGGQVVEQLVRPTGLTDPTIELRPSQNQIEDLVVEIMLRQQAGQRTLVTTLTKKMAEVLTEYLNDQNKILELIKSAQNRLRVNLQDFSPARTESLVQHDEHHDSFETQIIWQSEELPVEQMAIGPIDAKYYNHLKNQVQPGRRMTTLMGLDQAPMPKVAYLHSDVETLDRSDILADLRGGVYDVLVGINLLREGLDLPEVSLVAILDADKEGFLRSSTALIQTMGRAARHLAGHVILYADQLTRSMQVAMSETARRRRVQIKYNLDHSITPTSINKPIRDQLIARDKADNSRSKHLQVQFGKETVDLTKFVPSSFTPEEKMQLIKILTKQMKQAALDLDFETAATLRDSIHILQ